MKSLTFVNTAVINMLKDDQGAVLVEYAISMLVFSMVGFEGFVHIALGMAGIYQNDTSGIGHLSVNSFLVRSLKHLQ
jgi:hypothetical protein